MQKIAYMSEEVHSHHMK